MTTNSSDNNFVEVRNATKNFNSPEGGIVAALDGVSLNVGANEFVTLLGPSGCGKTTLLRSISGFEALTSGEILIDGQPMENSPPHHRPVNTVFQNYALFPHLTVGDNVGYSLDVAHVDKLERNKRVSDVLDLVGLAGLDRRQPKQLSGGQQQRVALARAVVSRPKLLLLDEPLSALDRKLRQAMQLELKNLQHELGISFVFVTHDQEEALTMSDRIVVMNNGQIQQIGAPTEIYDNPENSFVANFIGESNMFEARVVEITGDVAKVETATGIKLAIANSNFTIGDEVNAIIRPEQFHLTSSVTGEAPPSDYEMITATLRQVVFVGTDFQIIAELPGGKILNAVVRDTARVTIGDYAVGTELSFHYLPSIVHVINPDAGA